VIPPLSEGEVLGLEKLAPSQHFTKPPPRFSDSSLVKALEEEGIGQAFHVRPDHVYAYPARLRAPYQGISQSYGAGV